jgi:hygromycin-B 4-O-kinase
MDKDLLIKELLPETVDMTPKGFISDELSNEDFQKMHKVFF